MRGRDEQMIKKVFNKFSTTKLTPVVSAIKFFAKEFHCFHSVKALGSTLEDLKSVGIILRSTTEQPWLKAR